MTRVLIADDAGDQRALYVAPLALAGFVVDEVRDAPDRPGREFVFIARKAG